MEIKLRNFKPFDSDRLDNILRSLTTHRTNYLNAAEACQRMEYALEEKGVDAEVKCDAKVEARLAKHHLQELYLERIMYIISEIDNLLADT